MNDFKGIFKEAIALLNDVGNNLLNLSGSKKIWLLVLLIILVIIGFHYPVPLLIAYIVFNVCSITCVGDFFESKPGYDFVMLTIAPYVVFIIGAIVLFLINIWESTITPLNRWLNRKF